MSKLTSQIGIGTSNIASLGKRITQNEVSNLFSLALELNVNLVDTADTYGSGDAERFIGNAIFNSRNKYFIITKAGFPYVALPSFFSPMNQIGKKIIQRINPNKKFSKKYLISSLKKSLQRLRTDYVDAFLLHEPTLIELLKYDDCYDALTEIKAAGLSNYVGISTCDYHVMEKAFSNIHLDIVQTPLALDAETSKKICNLSQKNSSKLIINQVFSSKNILMSSDRILETLYKNNIKKSDLYPLLIAYAISNRRASNVLIGTRSIDHLIQNVEKYKKYLNSKELFNTIDDIIL